MSPKAPRKKRGSAPLEIVPPAVTQTVLPVLALIEAARRRAYQAVNTELVGLY